MGASKSLWEIELKDKTYFDVKKKLKSMLCFFIFHESFEASSYVKESFVLVTIFSESRN